MDFLTGIAASFGAAPGTTGSDGPRPLAAFGVPGIGSLVPEPDPDFDRSRLGARVAELLPAGIRDVLAHTSDDPELVGRIAARAEQSASLQEQIARLQQTGAGGGGGSSGGAGADSGDPAGSAGPPDTPLAQLMGAQHALNNEIADDLVLAARHRADVLRRTLSDRYGQSGLFSATPDLAAATARSPGSARSTAVRIGATLVGRVADLDVLKAEYDAAVLRGDSLAAAQLAEEYRATYLEVRAMVEALESGTVAPAAPAGQQAARQGDFVAGRDEIEDAVDDVRTDPTDAQIDVSRDAIEEVVTTGKTTIFDDVIVRGIEQAIMASSRAIERSRQRMAESAREAAAERDAADEAAAEKRSARVRAAENSRAKRIAFQQALDQAAAERRAARNRSA